MSHMIRAFFNQQAATWDETVAEKDGNKLRRMARRLNITPGSTVLDIGTGTGVFLPFILDEVGHSGHVVCLDSAEEMLGKARGKGFKRDIDYLQADAARIPLRDQFFDVVICYSSFPHFQDKPRALAEINRVMKNGGKLTICHTSSRAVINEIHRSMATVRNDTIPERKEMQEMLTAAGFTGIRIADRPTSYLTSARKARHKKSKAI